MSDEPHESHHCCCKWHGSACCHDQWRKLQAAVDARLAEAAAKGSQ